MYKVHASEEFDKRAQKQLSPEIYRELPNIFRAIATKNRRGKCLIIPWLWEIKIHDKRLYYIIQNQTIVFISISDKNGQKDAINKIKSEKERFIRIVEFFRRSE